MQYYLKKLGHQEMGSIGVNGQPSRGRYIYISKNEAVLQFFPPLSQHITNDSSLLPIIPLYHNINTKVYCNYIYHNDKFTRFKGTRDEYRIYSNNTLEFNQLLFKQDDILIFKKDNVVLDGEEQTVYFLYLLNEKETSLYKECNSLIETSAFRGSHAIFNGRIPDMESKIESILNDGKVSVLIDDSVTKKVESEKEKDSMASLFNANTFRDFVMVGYQSLCAITRTVIKYESYMNLEAAHIKPKSHGGLFLPNNGMALGRDLHWAFDKGFFTLDNDYRVVIHPKTESSYLQSFAGTQIYLPENPFFRPSLENIDYHHDEVFGLFLTSGRL